MCSISPGLSLASRENEAHPFEASLEGDQKSERVSLNEHVGKNASIAA
jgi:hypothetical protein